MAAIVFRGLLERSERQPSQRSRAVGTDWVAKVKEIAQEQVPEPVQAAGPPQPAGKWGTFGLDPVSGRAPTFKRPKANNDAGAPAPTPRNAPQTRLDA